MAILGSFIFLIPMIMLCCGLISFVGKCKHLLSVLLSLEYIMLSAFWLMSLMISHLGGDSYFVLFCLTFAACEGTLGLSLVICVVRGHGNDNLNKYNLSMLQC